MAVTPLASVVQPGWNTVRPYRGGLFDAAVATIEGDGHWQMGVQYLSVQCGASGWVKGWCPNGGAASDPASHKKTADTTSPWQEQPDAFTVYELWRCSQVGMTTEEHRELAELRLRNGEQYEAEKAFDAINLLKGDDVFKINGDGPMSVPRAIGAVEQYAAQVYGTQAVMHLPRWTYPYLVEQRQVWGDYMHNGEPEGGAAGGLHTKLGTRLSFGAGYSGNAPDGSAPADPADFWIYVTGDVVIRRGPVHTADAFAYQTNERNVLSERTYLITTDCLLGAVPVDLG